MRLHEAHRRPGFDQEFERLHAPTFRDFSPGGPSADREGFKQGLVAWYSAFPDLEVSVDALVVDQEQGQVAIRWSAVGTHRGSFLGAEPTGRPTRFRGIEIITVVGETLTERWGEWDAKDLLGQLGVLPEPGDSLPRDHPNAARRNIEAKYECADLASVRQRAMALGAEPRGVMKQQDTFFRAALSRLKLRTFGDGTAELISYRRTDESRVRGSDYVTCAVSNPERLAQTLSHALGTTGVVSKERELWLHGSTRIHLDRVENLGAFVELETVLDGKADEGGHRELHHVAEVLGLGASRVVAKPYLDLLDGRATEDAPEEAQMRRVLVSSGPPYEKPIGFSRAVRAGNIIAVAGTASVAANGTTVAPGDVYLQTRRCLEISLEAVAQAGGRATDVVRTRILLTDISRWEEAARAHGEVFTAIRPACTFAGVAAFIRPDWLVETEVDCVVGDAEINSGP
jgi:predicted adenylyl cyclase CyaB